MKKQKPNPIDECHRAAGILISRRVAVGSSMLALLGLLSRSVTGQTHAKPSGTRGADPNAATPRRGPQQNSEARAFLDRIRGAANSDERMRVMAEMSAANRKRVIESMKEQLGVSDKEWLVIRPRLETVFDLAHPTQQPPGSPAAPATDLDQKRRDLQELLKDEKAPIDQVKAKLAAYRAAKEKADQELTRARKSLRDILTLRQEALLVLNGLLT
jgi:hypothetical protein